MDISADRVEKAIRDATEFMFSSQREDFHWCGELIASTMGTAEYTMVSYMLGLDLSPKRERMIHHILGLQRPNGSWSIAFHQVEGDISTTTEAYLALRILGVEPSLEAMKKAESFILEKGGLNKVRVFTRIFLALFGIIPWETIPTIPVELMLLPPQALINIYSFASWARSTMIPLFIVFHHKPLYALPNGRFKNNRWLDHLFRPVPDPSDSSSKFKPYGPPLLKVLKAHGLISWTSLFSAVDPLIRIYDKYPVGFVRRYALRKCTEWVVDRLEVTGDTAGILPPMLYGLLAMTLQGYSMDSKEVTTAIDAIHRFSWEDQKGGYRIQICNSPVWDTALGTVGMVDCLNDPKDGCISRAVQWILDRQILVEYGDWKVYRPDLRGGGWSFEYSNTWYPDVDDTAAVILALLKQDPGSLHRQPVQRAAEWVLGMQNKSGGWGAFDVDNEQVYLNEIPFSDMDQSLSDPATPDVTGRVVEAFGLLLQTCSQDDSSTLNGCTDEFPQELLKQVREACKRALVYLRESQEDEGSWYGRWGVNYIYGTSNVLCGLSYHVSGPSDEMVARGIEWMKRCQNPDGGWGEALESYADKRTMGVGESTASQTAWAVMGLLAFLPPSDMAVCQGVRWLVENQVSAEPVQGYEGGLPLPLPRGCTWNEPQSTGTGFANHVYLNYTYYRHYFPMMALGRYSRAVGKSTRYQ